MLSGFFAAAAASAATTRPKSPIVEATTSRLVGPLLISLPPPKFFTFRQRSHGAFNFRSFDDDRRPEMIKLAWNNTNYRLNLSAARHAAPRAGRRPWRAARNWGKLGALPAPPPG
jgi:hypothetical protein